jgi:hypothetical protein
MRSPRTAVKKPDWLRLTEFQQSLLVVKDSVDGIGAGRAYLLLPLAAQLRALLVEKRRDNCALLLSVAAEFGAELTVFAGPQVAGSSDAAATLIDWGAQPFSAERQSADQTELSINQFLDWRVLRINGNAFSVGQLIKIAAEKGGGAHHPAAVPPDVIELLTFRALGLSPLRSILTAVGGVVLALGSAMLRLLTDLDVHVIVMLPQDRTTIICLLDAHDPLTGGRIQMNVDPLGRVVAHCVGVDSFWWRLASSDLLTPDERSHVMLSVRVSATLHTEASISLNSAPATKLDMPQPTLLSNAEQDYEIMTNRAFDNSTLSGEFALASIAMARAGQNLADDASLLLDRARLPDAENERYLLLRPGEALQFGTRASGAAPPPPSGSTVVDSPPDGYTASSLRERWRGQRRS